MVPDKNTIAALFADLSAEGVRLTQKQLAALQERWNRRFVVPDEAPVYTDSALLSTHAIAEMLQVDPSTVSKWIDKGHITGFATPGGHRRVRAKELREFLVKFKMPVPSELGGAA